MMKKVFKSICFYIFAIGCIFKAEANEVSVKIDDVVYEAAVTTLEEFEKSFGFTVKLDRSFLYRTYIDNANLIRGGVKKISIKDPNIAKEFYGSEKGSSEKWISPFAKCYQKAANGDVSAAKHLLSRLMALRIIVESRNPSFYPMKEQGSPFGVSIAEYYAVRTGDIKYSAILAKLVMDKIDFENGKSASDLLEEIVYTIDRMPDSLFEESGNSVREAYKIISSSGVRFADDGYGLSVWVVGADQFSDNGMGSVAMYKQGVPYYGEGYVNGLLKNIVINRN